MLFAHFSSCLGNAKQNKIDMNGKVTTKTFRTTNNEECGEYNNWKREP